MTIDDARTVPRDSILDTDVCIVGAGAAGITIARELIGTSLSVMLLESGGEQPDPATDDLRVGIATGQGYSVDQSRLRYFGGTTNHWTGWCRPLDAIDFEERPWIENSGWPFGLETLDPYYDRARTVLELGPGSFAAADSNIEPLAHDGIVTTAIYRFAPSPVRFGPRYRAELAAAPNVRTLLYANLVDFDPTPDRRHVDTIRVATLSGNRFQVRARAFVLAMGGIENARMLLVGDLGNERDLVGRYFMEHYEIGVATILAAGPLPPGYSDLAGDIRAAVMFTPETLREREFPSMSFAFEKLREGRGDPTVDAADVAAVIQAVEGRDFIPYTFWLRGEQSPDPDSRITLTDERDALGLPRVSLHWKYADADRPRYRRALDLMLARLGAAGRAIARVEPTDFGGPNTAFFYGNHHMGTTRMHTDPQRGVVNPDARLHAVDNLYVAGSSVFPTVGLSNPTFTIVALALRLADHLRSSL